MFRCGAFDCKVVDGDSFSKNNFRRAWWLMVRRESAAAMQMRHEMSRERAQDSLLANPTTHCDQCPEIINHPRKLTTSRASFSPPYDKSHMSAPARPTPSLRLP